ncbi:AI-2E family transporter [Nocardioides sp. SYSU DS0663]|uniref:AI-2E family transporter n=1 Tax=Nocardioides sp. SYSU DS0663 TaxID=3416445 RepID=UPI003F4C0B61
MAPVTPEAQAPMDDPRPPAGRTERLGSGLRWLGTWSWRWVGVGGGAALLARLVGVLWVVVFPAFLAVIVASVLAPVQDLLVRRARFPRTLAATVVLVGALGLIVGAVLAIAPSVSGQWNQLVSDASDGIDEVRSWAESRGLISQEQVDDAVSQARDRLQESAGSIASGLLVGVNAVSSGLVTLAITLVLTFLYLKDGHRFGAWAARTVGPEVGPHLHEVLSRIWHTLGGFVRTQAIVSFVDAVLIGIALAVIGVPLAVPLAVLTFLGGFVPIIGAFVVGGLAVLVALVSVGVQGALLVLAAIIVVQQIEGNLLQPWLQSRAMQLHAGVVILAVTLGSTLFGIAGAFLAVPVAAMLAVVLRYLSGLADPAGAVAAPAEIGSDAADESADAGGVDDDGEHRDPDDQPTPQDEGAARP